MSEAIDLFVMKIAPTEPLGTPCYSGMATMQCGSCEDARKHVDELARGVARAEWTTVAAQVFDRVNALDIRAKPNASAMFAFFLDDHCKCHFDKVPFLELPLAGSPDGGSIAHCQTHGERALWASLELKAHEMAQFARIPIVFNFVDDKSGRSPFYLMPHDAHADGSKHGGSVGYIETHGGIHPPVGATNINFF